PNTSVSQAGRALAGTVLREADSSQRPIGHWPESCRAIVERFVAGVFVWAPDCANRVPKLLKTKRHPGLTVKRNAWEQICRTLPSPQGHADREVGEVVYFQRSKREPIWQLVSCLKTATCLLRIATDPAGRCGVRGVSNSPHVYFFWALPTKSF